MEQEPPSHSPSSSSSHGRRWLARVGVGVAVSAAVVVSGAVTYAAARDRGSDGETETATLTASSHEHPSTTDAAAASNDLAAATADEPEHEHEGERRRHHDHPTLPPYADRYAAASEDEQAAADALLSQVRTTLQPYQDVDAAVAAGYQAPARPRGPIRHYVNLELARDDAVLDPAHPEGLVYYTGGGGDPVLLGAFFVAPAGTPAPNPAGDLVVWHSHNSDRCPGFFATEDEPCTDARRMLHVWTVDQVELVGRRAGRSFQVEVTDPFGAPFRAAVEPVS